MWVYNRIGKVRYFVWVMPIIFVMIGRVLERHFHVIQRWPIIVMIIAFELISVRALFPLPPHGPRIQRSIPEEALARYLPDGWAMSEMNAYAAEPKSVLAIVVLTLLMAGLLWLAMRRHALAFPTMQGGAFAAGNLRLAVNIPGVGRSTRVPLSNNTFGKEEFAAVNAVMESGRLTMGERCREFERQFEAFFGVSHAVFVNSGSSANLLAMFAVANQKAGLHRQLAAGAEVILPAVTWPTTVWPVVQAGAVPVFVDCDPASLQMRVAAIEDAITPRTRAILPTHVLGNMCDMASVMAIAGRHDLWVVEDACEALGDSIGGGFAGSIGDIGTFSFYFSHHISTIEGRMVVTENDDLADLLRSMRSHGWTKGMTAHRALAQQADDIDSRFLFVNPGFNLRPTEIGAALGLSQLVRLPEFNRPRARTAAHWDAAFEALVGRGDLEFMRPPPEGRPMHFAYAVLCRNKRIRDQVRSSLDDHGIETRPIIAGNITRQPTFRDIEYRVSSGLSGADEITDRGLYWGLNPTMQQSEIDLVTKRVLEFFEK